MKTVVYKSLNATMIDRDVEESNSMSVCSCVIHWEIGSKSWKGASERQPTNKRGRGGAQNSEHTRAK
jgi:aspartyl aminopeptidase